MEKPSEPEETSHADSPNEHPSRHASGLLKRFLGSLGPGLITGAADDDPSGVATYTIAGAQLGTTLLWLSLFSWPLMGMVQMMCARIGMVSGRGLSSAFKARFPNVIVMIAIVALLAANTLNVGADLAGMADAANLITGTSAHVWIVLFSVGITWGTIRLRYYSIARVLKWLCIALFSYVAVAFVIRIDWARALRDTFIPGVPHGKDEWQTIVAILGTTISPYLFFWQAAQEVEEEKSIGRNTLGQRKNATSRELADRRLDVGTGTFFSNFVMFFIILVAAATLHAAGKDKIETTRQAAEALRPLAGHFAYLLYTLGILGVGFLAIPTLTGSAAYAFAEFFAWRQGLDKKMRRARAFYGVIVFSTVIAVGIVFSGIDPVKALYWSAVINGLLAPFLLVGILLIARDTKIMAGQPSSRISQIGVAITAVAMFVAGAAMFFLN